MTINNSKLGTGSNRISLDKSEVLHAAKHIIQMELMLNRQVEKFLEKLGLTREEVTNHE